MTNHHKLFRTKEVTGTQVWKPRQCQANKDELVTQQEIVKHLSEKLKVHKMGKGSTLRICPQKCLNQSRSIQTWGHWPSSGLARWASHWIQGNWCSGFTQTLYFDHELLGRKWWVTGAPPSAVWKAFARSSSVTKGRSPSYLTCQQISFCGTGPMYLSVWGSAHRDAFPSLLVFHLTPTTRHTWDALKGVWKMLFITLLYLSKRSPAVYVAVFS